MSLFIIVLTHSYTLNNLRISHTYFYKFIVLFELMRHMQFFLIFCLKVIGNKNNLYNLLILNFFLKKNSNHWYSYDCCRCKE